jgi:thiol-disulfide isomerase/thioredoxin
VWGGLGWLHNALTHGTEYPLPELAVERLGGGTVSLASFRGQPVVLNLWASWCPPCRREMPVLEAAQQARPDVQFLFVNQGEGAPAVRQYLQIEQLSELQNILLDPADRVGRHFRTRALPTTLFFNTAGQLVDTHLGALTRAHLDEHLRALLSIQP